MGNKIKKKVGKYLPKFSTSPRQRSQKHDITTNARFYRCYKILIPQELVILQVRLFSLNMQNKKKIIF